MSRNAASVDEAVSKKKKNRNRNRKKSKSPV